VSTSARLSIFMYFFHDNISCSNSISDIMVLDSGMLGLGVMDIILSQMDSTLTIWKHCSDTLWNSKLYNKAFQPCSFLHSLSCSSR